MLRGLLILDARGTPRTFCLVNLSELSVLTADRNELNVCCVGWTNMRYLQLSLSGCSDKNIGSSYTCDVIG
jgi:hypothetical protein